MNRSSIVESIKSNNTVWDILVIGGGATGLGTAVDAASRGYKTLLLEQHDFAKGTSSRSTKLIHGGVRYLRQGNISLVLEALKERGRLLNNAPHLVKNQSFIVPNYKWWEKPYYRIGLTIYDLLAGKLGFGRSKTLSKQKTLQHIPCLSPEKLKGGILYHDGQFDDSRLAVNLMQTVFDHGGIAVNYLKVVNLIKSGGKISGVAAKDRETSECFDIKAKALAHEIEFLLVHAGKYLTMAPATSDVRSVFTGLRPLASFKNGKKTKSISREHTLLTDTSGLITITGGKWTTYRKMAEETVDRAALVAKLPRVKSVTSDLKIHGWTKYIDQENPYALYGSDAVEIGDLAFKNGIWDKKLHQDLQYKAAEVVWAVRNEMACTVEDVLSRRTRALLLDAKASIECAPEVARLMAKEMNKDRKWVQNQISNYNKLAGLYILT